MDFALETDQALLVDTAKAFFADLDLDLNLDQADAAERVWSDVVALGWPGLLVPEAQGGVGGSLLDAVLLTEQFGYAGVASPFVSSAVVGSTLLAAAGRSDALADLATGRKRVALALAEENGEFTPQAVRLTVADGTLTGEKRFVRDADGADALIVAARDGADLGAFLVPRDEVRVTSVPTLSGENVYGIRFDAVAVSTERRLGAAGGGWNVLQHGVAAGALARAAEMVGLAQRIVDVVVEYAKVREQSGQPIGSFQAVQHHCADMLRDLEGARYITYRAASADGKAGQVPADVAMAKAYASDACLAVARRAHQVMGAIGYCDEHVLHRLHKRIHGAAQDFGDANSHLDEVAAQLGLI